MDARQRQIDKASHARAQAHGRLIVQTNEHGYDAGLEQLLKKLVEAGNDGLSDEAAGAALATQAQAWRVNGRLADAFAALRTGVEEPLREDDAVQRQGPVEERRWHAGAHIERARNALRRAWWRERTQSATHVRAAVRCRPDDEHAGTTMIVRTMQIAEQTMTDGNGILGLAELVDNGRIDALAHRRGEVHVEHLLDTSRSDPLDTTPPPGLEWCGECVRGRDDETCEAKPQETGGWTSARIAEGTWMEREIACDGDAYELLAELAAEPIDWEEWRIAEGAPLTRWVRWVHEPDDANPGPRRRAGAPLRYRTQIEIEVYEPAEGKRWLAPTMAMRGATIDASEHALAKAIKAGERSASALVVHAHYSEDGEDADIEGRTPVRLAPEARTQHGWTDHDGSTRMPTPEHDPLKASAERCTEAGWEERALVLNRRRVALCPWALGALDDLATSHQRAGHRDEHQALRNEIVRRGLAMLPEGFAWAEGAMDAQGHENHAFLYACFEHAGDHERAGLGDAAIEMWDRIARASGRDGFGARYEALRCAVALGRWDNVAAKLQKLEETDDASAEAAFARALCINGLGAPGHEEAARNALARAAARHPLIASRIMQRERAPARGAQEGYISGGFSEAERYWARYHGAWRARRARALWEGLADARSTSGRTAEVRRTPSILSDRKRIEANMAHYRSAVAGLAAQGVRHTDELWDLLRELEAGDTRARIGSAEGNALIGWTAVDGTELEVAALGQWRAQVTQSETDGTKTTWRSDFETVTDEWRNIGERRDGTAPGAATVGETLGKHAIERGGVRDPRTLH